MNPSNEILVALETLAASFPWDEVSIWAGRTPEDPTPKYSAYIPSKELYPCIFGEGKTAMEAVEKAVKQGAGRISPEDARLLAIKELQEKIAKLEAVRFELPPYIPNRELSQFVTKITTVDV